MTRLRSIIFGVTVLALAGCSVPGGRRYPIVGFGWVTITTTNVNVTTVKTRLVGGGITTLPPALTVGYSVTTLTEAGTNNLILELK